MYIFSGFKKTNTFSQFGKIGVEMNLRIWQSEQRKTHLNIYQPFWSNDTSIQIHRHTQLTRIHS